MTVTQTSYGSTYYVQGSEVQYNSYGLALSGVSPSSG